MKKSDLDEKVEYFAKDSTRVDRKNGIMYLYGRARVIYQDFELDADYIRFNSKDNTIFARGIKTDKGKYVGRPIFKMGREGSSIADSLTYNTKTGKGTVSGVFTEQEGGFFSGGKTKMQPDNEFNVSGTTYSTCNLPEPHYGIHITKGIATENQIITGPVYLEFERVPLPIAIPFGFFPKPNKKSSGIILPTPGEDATKGFSLTNGGYYLALNDYWDARLTGDIYTNGSYHLNLATNYIKRYKFGGNFNLAYASDRQGLEGTPEYDPQKNFHIGWTHSQNANAKPGTTFSASVNAGTGNYFSVSAANGTYDINQIASNTMSSSIAYGKVFGDGLFNLTTSLSHSQETRAKTISLTLPQVSLNMSTISPFDSKNRVGEQKWYQKITVGYSMQASNTVNTREDLLFDKDGLKRFRNGMQHSIPISLPFNVLKYLNFNSSVNYNERWYLQSVQNRYFKRPNSSDSVAIDTLNGFKRAGEYSLSLGMSTKLYGGKKFKNLGSIKAIRHVMTPNVSFSYKPDFSTNNYGYYKNKVYYTNDIRPGKSVPLDGDNLVRDYQGLPQKYSIFEGAQYGGPSAGKQASIGFSVDNNVELKVSDSKDTTGTGEKKIPIIQGLNFSSSYNFVAPTKKLAPINFGGRSQFTDKLGFNFSGVFSPYAVQNVPITSGSGPSQTTTYQYQEVDRYVWKDGKLPRLTSFNFSFDYSLNPDALKGRNKNMDALKNQTDQQQAGRTPEQIEQLQAISRDPNAFVDFNIPWNIAFSYSFNYNNSLGLASTRSISNTLNFNGDFNLTPKWKIQFNSGYDFKAKTVSYTSFAIYRDLHCWDLSANWIPFGSYQSYSIDIKVKASILQDLKLSKRKGYYTKY
ncbi:MAG: putative LPS assembly protein LptD [Pedobacter sp.]|uniref:putative LPS assembly protein LptD n=1 Tax=Pedobacter sp. TaxID=1411316 RepID=UPI00356A3273